MAVKPKNFFDTNVLVYQFDRSSPDKQQRAQELIGQSILDETAVISSQVIQEFMNVSLKNFATPLTATELTAVLADLLAPLCRHVPTLDFYQRALGLYASASISFYDTLIIQAAIDLGCSTIYSEDLQDGRQFGGLTIKNPFQRDIT